MNTTLVSYAQNREDLILQAFFADVQTGTYVDVGANHPIKHSVTKLFYQKGWRGIHVEPNESLCDLLRFDRPEDVVLNEGVSNKPGKLPFTEYANHGLSTFSPAMRDEYKGQRSVFTDTFREYEVPVRTLADIFATQRTKHIHFMKVDVEGYEYEVLEGNDWQTYRPELICIESNHIVRDWRPLLKAKGYKKVFNDGLNDYYLADESAQRATQFSYAKSLLESGEVVTLPVAQALFLAGTQHDLQNARIERLEYQKAKAEFQNNWYENAPFLWLCKKALRAFDRAVTNRMTNSPQIMPAYAANASLSTYPAEPAKTAQSLARSYHRSVRPGDPPQRGVGAVLLGIVWLGYRIIRKVLRTLLRFVRGTK